MNEEFLHNLIFFSGGTGLNPLADKLTKYTEKVCYVIPTSGISFHSFSLRLN
jgi:hypothetical protein